MTEWDSGGRATKEERGASGESRKWGGRMRCSGFSRRLPPAVWEGGDKAQTRAVPNHRLKEK